MGGREGKIAIPIFPKVFFVTFGVFKILFGVIVITFGESSGRNISTFFLLFSEIIPIFAEDSSSLKGLAGRTFVVKRTFTNVIFYRQISQIKASEDTQPERPLWVYCTLSYSLDNVNISRRGLSSCLS